MTFQKDSTEKTINKSKEKDFLVYIISIILMLYIASLIVFKIEYYYVPHLFDSMLVGVFMLLVLMKKLKIYKINKVIFIYFIFSVFSLATSFWAKDFNTAMFKGFQLFLISLNIFIIYNIIRNYHIEKFFIYGVLLGSFFNFIFALEILPSPMAVYIDSRLQGTVGNANDLSVVMIISIFVSIIYLFQEKENHKSKVLYYYQYINIMLSLYLIVLSVSKKGIIFGFALVFIYILVSIKELKSFIRLGIASLIGFIVFVNFINFDDFWEIYSEIEHRFDLFGEGLSTNARYGSTGWRLYFIKLGLELFQNNPIIGVGINNFRLYSGGFYSHNNYIELLVGTGLVGFMIFYSIYVYLFRKILQASNFGLKFIFIFFLFILLGMDMATVSYVNKYIIYILLFISALLENNINDNGENYAKKD